MNTRRYIVLAGLAVVTLATAHAQSGSLKAQIPYAFNADKTALPAGAYAFSRTGAAVVITDSRGKQISLPVLTKIGGASAFRNATLVFDVSGGNRTLSEVWLPEQDGLLVHSTPKDHQHELVVIGAASEGLSGKAAYDQTCRRCHGPDGKGDPDADKFFRMSIPRLSSAYVQSKSDEELKTIVTHGRRNMDAVQIGEPQLKHPLTAGSVDAVIKHVRTLK